MPRGIVAEFNRNLSGGISFSCKIYQKEAGWRVKPPLSRQGDYSRTSDAIAAPPSRDYRRQARSA